MKFEIDGTSEAPVESPLRVRLRVDACNDLVFEMHAAGAWNTLAFITEAGETELMYVDTDARKASGLLFNTDNMLAIGR